MTRPCVRSPAITLVSWQGSYVVREEEDTHDVGIGEQTRVDLGLIFEHVQSGTHELSVVESIHECLFVDNRTASLFQLLA